MHHPTAVIETGAALGDNVSVGPFSYIAAGATVGDNCEIGPNVTIWGGASLGSGCRVHAGTVIGDLPQDTGFDGARSFVRIGNDCWIRECVTIHRGTGEDTETVAGDGCMFMAYSHLAHNVVVGDGVVLCNSAQVGGYVVVGDRAFISGNVSVHQFVHIGELAMVGANAFVSKDVPPFFTIHGAAMNEVAGINVVGMRRAGMSAEDRRQVKNAFKLLCLSRVNTRDAVAELRERYPEGPAARIWEFAGRSTRGLCTSGLNVG